MPLAINSSLRWRCVELNSTLQLEGLTCAQCRREAMCVGMTVMIKSQGSLLGSPVRTGLPSPQATRTQTNLGRHLREFLRNYHQTGEPCRGCVRGAWCWHVVRARKYELFASSRPQVSRLRCRCSVCHGQASQHARFQLGNNGHCPCPRMLLAHRGSASSASTSTGAEPSSATGGGL